MSGQMELVEDFLLVDVNGKVYSHRIKKVFYQQRHCLLLYMFLADLGQTATLRQRWQKRHRLYKQLCTPLPLKMYTSASENVHLCLRIVNWVTFSVTTGRISTFFILCYSDINMYKISAFFLEVHVFFQNMLLGKKTISPLYNIYVVLFSHLKSECSDCQCPTVALYTTLIEFTKKLCLHYQSVCLQQLCKF